MLKPSRVQVILIHLAFQYPRLSEVMLTLVKLALLSHKCLQYCSFSLYKEPVRNGFPDAQTFQSTSYPDPPGLQVPQTVRSNVDPTPASVP